MGKLNHLGDSQMKKLVENKMVYAADLSGISLGPGIYRMLILGEIHGSPPVIRRYELPLVHII